MRAKMQIQYHCHKAIHCLCSVITFYIFSYIIKAPHVCVPTPAISLWGMTVMITPPFCNERGQFSGIWIKKAVIIIPCIQQFFKSSIFLWVSMQRDWLDWVYGGFHGKLLCSVLENQLPFLDLLLTSWQLTCLHLNREFLLVGQVQQLSHESRCPTYS